MNPLLLLFISCIIVCTFFSILRITTYDKRKLQLLVCGGMLLFFHIFKDIYTLPDITAYTDLFDQIHDANSHSIWILTGLTRFEPGWMILTYLLTLCGQNHLILIVVTSLIIIIGYLIFIYRYSPIIWLSLVILFAFGYCQSLYVLRQYCALSICLFALPSIINQKLFRFLGVTCLAIMFHYSAIIFLPIYWLYRINITRTLIIKLIIATPVVGLLSKIIVIGIASSASYYAHYFDPNGDEAATSATGFFINVAVFLLCLSSFKLTKLHGINKLLFIMLCVATVLSCAGIGIPGVVRLNIYYTTSYVCLIPIAVSNQKQILKIPISIVIAICFSLIFFIALNGTSLIDYKIDI